MMENITGIITLVAAVLYTAVMTRGAVYIGDKLFFGGGQLTLESVVGAYEHCFSKSAAQGLLNTLAIGLILKVTNHDFLNSEQFRMVFILNFCTSYVLVSELNKYKAEIVKLTYSSLISNPYPEEERGECIKSCVSSIEWAMKFKLNILFGVTYFYFILVCFNVI